MGKFFFEKLTSKTKIIVGGKVRFMQEKYQGLVDWSVTEQINI
jgi:hypothetical protein